MIGSGQSLGVGARRLPALQTRMCLLAIAVALTGKPAHCHQIQAPAAIAAVRLRTALCQPRLQVLAPVHLQPGTAAQTGAAANQAPLPARQTWSRSERKCVARNSSPLAWRPLPRFTRHMVSTPAWRPTKRDTSWWPRARCRHKKRGRSRRKLGSRMLPLSASQLWVSRVPLANGRK